MSKRKYPPLTSDQIDLIASMRAKNASYEEIAAAIADGRAPNTIYWHCLKHGIDPENPKFRRAKTRIITPTVKRGNHIVRRFTPAEDKKLLRLEATRPALRISEIARRMNRNHNSIKGRLYTLARHQERLEEA